MGSMLKFDSERRDLVRERRNARIERKQQRRQARERKHSQTAGVTPEPASVMHRLAEREMHAAVDRIVDDVLDRHEQPAPVIGPPWKPSQPRAVHSRSRRKRNQRRGRRRRARTASITTRP